MGWPSILAFVGRQGPRLEPAETRSLRRDGEYAPGRVRDSRPSVIGLQPFIISHPGGLPSTHGYRRVEESPPGRDHIRIAAGGLRRLRPYLRAAGRLAGAAAEP